MQAVTVPASNRRTFEFADGSGYRTIARLAAPIHIGLEPAETRRIA